ncbi:MAG: cytidylate kinase-like family protein, partial [Clostridiales bacterium]|nr:cytidylate kinase-like family protein [Clostridiales bacterium]
LIDRIMQETGVSERAIEMAEKGKDMKGRSHELSNTKAPTKYVNMTERMVYIQTQIIKKLADRASCVFIGRCSDYVLKDREDCLNVFVYAPNEVRVKNIMDVLHVSEAQAQTLIEENDHILHARYKQMTGTYRGDRHNRHLLIDSSVLGVDGTAKFIEQFAALKFAGK